MRPAVYGFLLKFHTLGLSLVFMGHRDLHCRGLSHLSRGIVQVAGGSEPVEGLGLQSDGQARRQVLGRECLWFSSLAHPHFHHHAHPLPPPCHHPHAPSQAGASHPSPLQALPSNAPLPIQRRQPQQPGSSSSDPSATAPSLQPSLLSSSSSASSSP